MDPQSQDLLDTIMTEQAHISEDMHRLARRQNVLREAATKLRTGKAAELVEAELAHELPKHSNITVLNRSMR